MTEAATWSPGGKVTTGESGSGFLGWILGGVGIILLYSAFKNESPLSVIQGVLTGSPRKTIDPTIGENPVTGAPPGTVNPGEPTENDELWSNTQLERSAKLMARQVTPVLAPIPTQPNMLLDISAIPAFLSAQAVWGRPIILTGAYRSPEAQRVGHAQDPERFAAPGKSAHEYGIGIDVNTDKTDVNDPKFIATMNRFGWVAAGRSGPMHYSYGIRA